MPNPRLHAEIAHRVATAEIGCCFLAVRAPPGAVASTDGRLYASVKLSGFDMGGHDREPDELQTNRSILIPTSCWD